MRAISLWQPWASLIVGGHKRYETRSWSTDVRGCVLIHAALKWGKTQAAIAARDPFASALAAMGLSIDPLTVPRGALLGSIEIVDCVPCESVRDNLDDAEREYGDYTYGRYAWVLSEPRLLSRPVLYRGGRGFFDVPRAVVRGLF